MFPCYFPLLNLFFAQVCRNLIRPADRRVNNLFQIFIKRQFPGTFSNMGSEPVPRLQTVLAVYLLTRYGCPKFELTNHRHHCNLGRQGGISHVFLVRDNMRLRPLKSGRNGRKGWWHHVDENIKTTGNIRRKKVAQQRCWLRIVHLPRGKWETWQELLSTRYLPSIQTKK